MQYEFPITAMVRCGILRAPPNRGKAEPAAGPMPVSDLNGGVMRCAVACLFGVLLLIGVGRAARADAQAGDRDVTISNRGAKAIDELYVSPASADHWGEDRLGDDTLAPGQSLRLKLGHPRDCVFDVQAVYGDGSHEDSKGVNVCRTHGLSFDGSTATAPAPAPAREVAIANRSARPIQQVFISPGDAGDWGEDRLVNNSLSVGESTTLRYRGDCVADLRIVFDNRAAEERRGVDVCASRSIAIQPGWTTADTLPTEARPGAEAVQLSVTNRTGHAIAALYVFAAKSHAPGPDLLGNAGLAEGAGVTIAFARPAGICRFVARAVFAAGEPAETVDGIDLCRSLELVLPAKP